MQRFDLINYLIKYLNRTTTYIEIGVKVPNECFNKINATDKYSVDPGYEVEENLADYPMTSDDFFDFDINIHNSIDIIFIDGLHKADQVERDIKNSLECIKDDGFIVVHDCNPPTAYHTRENYGDWTTSAGPNWNGSVWKAFINARKDPSISACCIDSDWGLGVISKKLNFGTRNIIDNPYYEYDIFNQNRKESLNLLTPDEFKKIVK